ncbi:hypothetical protein II898_06615 [bacterium]|nr:hypothetical protein [bacterium]
MKLKIKDRYFSIALFILFVIYMLFTLADLSASKQSGFRDADRSMVHRYLILMTSYLFVYAVFNIKKLKLQQPVTFLVLLGLWTTLVNVFNNVSTWILLIQLNMAVLWCLSYIFFNRLRSKESKYKSSIEIFSYLLWLFYAVVTLYYFLDMMIRLDRIPVLNVAYYEMALLPWVLINSSGKNKKWLYLISMAVAMLSMKRGAIIAMALMILADSYVTAKRINSYKTFFRITAIIFVFGVIIAVADNLSGGFLSQRFSSEELADGSGRADQFSIVWEDIKTRDLFELMLGSGSEKSLQLLGTGIHNDWLNFLFCYGLIGLLMYAGLIIGFIQKSILVLKMKSDLAYSCFVMTALYLVMSMVSSGYSAYVGFWLFGFWGYFNAEVEMKSNSKTENNEGKR